MTEKRGNPNPSPATRFKPGNTLGMGKTSAQRKAEIANAEKATLIRGRLLDAVVAATTGGADLAHIEASILKLIRDAEDRGLGTATQSIDHTLANPDGSNITFQTIVEPKPK